MIYLGYSDPEKLIEIEKYRTQNDIHRTFIISADAFPLAIKESETITYSQAIQYVYFYRLLQQIDKRTLIVINECLRTQNRYDLTYNCIRNFLNQTEHQLIFQQLPQIDTRDDFMILFDFDTRSRWKRQKFNNELIQGNVQLHVKPLEIKFKAIKVLTSEETKRKYDKEKKERFETIGLKDPHTIPRNLYLIGGRDKLDYINGHKQLYVARNKRLGNDCIVTYDEVNREQYTIVELPHNFVDFSDFVRKTNQTNSEILVADLRVDNWYFNLYTEWADRINETYASLQ